MTPMAPRKSLGVRPFSVLVVTFLKNSPAGGLVCGAALPLVPRRAAGHPDADQHYSRPGGDRKRQLSRPELHIEFLTFRHS